MWEVLKVVVTGAVLLSLLLGAIAFASYRAGVLAGRKAGTEYTIGEALAAYTISMISLLSALVFLAWVSELVFAN